MIENKSIIFISPLIKQIMVFLISFTFAAIFFGIIYLNKNTEDNFINEFLNIKQINDNKFLFDLLLTFTIGIIINIATDEHKNKTKKILPIFLLCFSQYLFTPQLLSIINCFFFLFILFYFLFKDYKKIYKKELLTLPIIIFIVVFIFILIIIIESTIENYNFEFIMFSISNLFLSFFTMYLILNKIIQHIINITAYNIETSINIPNTFKDNIKMNFCVFFIFYIALIVQAIEGNGSFYNMLFIILFSSLFIHYCENIIYNEDQILYKFKKTKIRAIKNSEYSLLKYIDENLSDKMLIKINLIMKESINKTQNNHNKLFFKIIQNIKSNKNIIKQEISSIEEEFMLKELYDLKNKKYPNNIKKEIMKIIIEDLKIKTLIEDNDLTKNINKNIFIHCFIINNIDELSDSQTINIFKNCEQYDKADLLNIIDLNSKYDIFIDKLKTLDKKGS